MKIRLTNCALANPSSRALLPARRSIDIFDNGGNRLSVKTKIPRWFVLRLSICLRKAASQRSLQRNLITSRGVCGRGDWAENLYQASANVVNDRGGPGFVEEGGYVPFRQPLPDSISQSVKTGVHGILSSGCSRRDTQRSQWPCISCC